MLFLIIVLISLLVIIAVCHFYKKNVTNNMMIKKVSPKLEKSQLLLETLQTYTGDDLMSSDVSQILFLFNPLATNEDETEQNSKVTKVTTEFLKNSDLTISVARQDMLNKELNIRNVAVDLLSFVENTKFKPQNKPEYFHKKLREYKKEIEILLEDQSAQNIDNLVVEISNLVYFIEEVKGKYNDSHCCSLKKWGIFRTLHIRFENAYVTYGTSEDTFKRALSEKKLAQKVFSLHGIV